MAAGPSHSTSHIRAMKNTKCTRLSPGFVLMDLHQVIAIRIDVEERGLTLNHQGFLDDLTVGKDGRGKA